jgi:hypothetical protein
MSGLSRNWSCIKSLLLLGSNPSDQDDLAKELEPILLSPNDREGDLANIPSLIRLCPNDHAVVLARSLEHVHRLVGSYPRSQ